MAFADPDWYAMVAATIDALYVEELHRHSDIIGAATWLYHAREEARDVEWIRAQIRQSPEWHAIHDQPPRPTPIRQAPLPPFEAGDQWGMVHTTLPADYDPTPRRNWPRGDLGGVTLTETPPLVPGANTTPPEMTMSFLLPWYPRVWQDKILAAHAARGYTHFLLDRLQADKAGLSSAQFMDLLDYVRSWGFYPACWLTSSGEDRTLGWTSVASKVEPILRGVLASAKLTETFIALPGEEINNGTPPGGPTDGLIATVCALCAPTQIPVWLHFTANYPAWIPDGPPAGFDQRLVDWIAQWHGRVTGLAWQANQSQSAGLMGAKFWDARRYWGRASTDFVCCAWEVKATDQLFGRCDEAHGCLRSYELVCAPHDPEPTYPSTAGYMNGGRLPNGDPL